MIKICIIEDELPALKRLKKILQEVEIKNEVVMHCDSLNSSIEYLKSEPDIDLLLMDIKLGDGLSLEIFEQVKLSIPIIFITAYDEFTLKAFKLMSIDYLLKPIDISDLSFALQKFQSWTKKDVNFDMQKIWSELKGNKTKEKYLIKQGNQLLIVFISEIAYFYTEDGYTFLVTHENKKYILDETLDTLQKEVNNKDFFRINRAMIIKLSSIKKIEQYFNSRFTLTILPDFKAQVIVSRERVKEFKEWLEG
jgi:DNA-binding LytR/AlgR family response regulator